MQSMISSYKKLKKISVKNETYGHDNIDYDIDEKKLYGIDKLNLYENK